MNTAFFTEGAWFGKINRDHTNMRTDAAWMCALDADHYPIHQAPTNKQYDIGIVIIPKVRPSFDLSRIKACCTRVGIMQEGPNWFWQDWPVEQQVNYIFALSEADFLLVHNESDKFYYEGLIPSKPVHVMPSLMIEDCIDKDSIVPDYKRSGVIIGGNFVSWYGGMDSYMIAQELSDDGRVFAPTMGRMPQAENHIEGLEHIEYRSWSKWISSLSGFKYAVHLMRTHAAGTFALNCAYLGIPCIGYKGLDTQMVCHPNTSIDVGDLRSARRIARHLKNEPEFYKHCSVLARDNYKSLFSEKVFHQEFKAWLYGYLNNTSVSE